MCVLSKKQKQKTLSKICSWTGVGVRPRKLTLNDHRKLHQAQQVSTCFHYDLVRYTRYLYCIATQQALQSRSEALAKRADRHLDKVIHPRQPDQSILIFKQQQ